MASLKVRADRALEAAERYLVDAEKPGRMDPHAGEVSAVAAACKLALKPDFSDGTGYVTLSGHEPAWMLPYFQEPQQP